VAACPAPACSAGRGRGGAEGGGAGVNCGGAVTSQAITACSCAPSPSPRSTRPSRRTRRAAHHVPRASPRARRVAAGAVGARAPRRSPRCAREAAPRPPATRVRCVSMFLDKNRRYIGKSQSKRPPKRTQRTPDPRDVVHAPMVQRQPVRLGAPLECLPHARHLQYFLTRTGVT
jgi:hypothetical protein